MEGSSQISNQLTQNNLLLRIEPDKPYGKVNDNAEVKASKKSNISMREAIKRARFVDAVMSDAKYRYITPQASRELDNIKPLVQSNNSKGRMIVGYDSPNMRLVDAARIMNATEGSRLTEPEIPAGSKPLDTLEKSLLSLNLKADFRECTGAVYDGVLKQSKNPMIITKKERQAREEFINTILWKVHDRNLPPQAYVQLKDIKGLQFTNIIKNGESTYFISDIHADNLSVNDAYRMVRLANQAPKNQHWV